MVPLTINTDDSIPRMLQFTITVKKSGSTKNIIENELTIVAEFTFHYSQEAQ